ncbi:hypothetical protein [Actinoalloteichus caeruleus]|uniref:hypothetical protein n=1 Tax=Actinoalloteichus cyanogriseus TaxID=2893586 RepID=UPI003AADAC60
MSSTPALLWGTNRPGGIFYAGRVHAVWPVGPRQAMCGLPVGEVWAHRPAVPARLCPDCCVAATSALFPPSPHPEQPIAWPPGAWVPAGPS